MNVDLRNSIHLWIIGLVFFGLSWAALHFGVFDGLSNGWVGSAAGILGIANLALLLWSLWQRRDANPDHPNSR